MSDDLFRVDIVFDDVVFVLCNIGIFEGCLLLFLVSVD